LLSVTAADRHTLSYRLPIAGARRARRNSHTETSRKPCDSDAQMHLALPFEARLTAFPVLADAVGRVLLDELGQRRRDFDLILAFAGDKAHAHHRLWALVCRNPRQRRPARR